MLCIYHVKRFKNINRIIDVTRKAMEANEVYLLSIASIVRPLLFPKNVSAPPAIVPDMPADLPDCSSTVTIMDIENKTCSTFMIIVPTLSICYLPLTLYI